MSKHVMLLAGMIGVAILSGCAAKPTEYYECRGNNCNREHSGESISALMVPAPVESVRPAA